ncbi:MAG: hypothetical protein ACJ8AO_02790 [Gemmatimonadaceae bacterium]
MPRPLRRLALFTALVVAAACAARNPAADAVDAPNPVVVFNNQSLYQADVYAISSSGSQVRLGTVQPGRRERLRVSNTALGGDRQIVVAARLLSRSRTPTSGRIGLLPGDTIEVVLTSDANSLTVLPVARP